MTHPNRELILEKLLEFKSREKTAKHFGFSRETLTRQLKKHGINFSFRGARFLEAEMKATPKFEVGQVCMWTPVKARVGCFGLPIATMSIEVRILRLKHSTGHYYAEVVHLGHRAQLSRPCHLVHENALKEIPTPQNPHVGKGI